MKISNLGEEKIIALLSQKFKVPDLTGLTGIGDDCAVIPLNTLHSQVITTDALTEDVHFIKNRISAFDLGFKSLAVNLSDIAAMGAKAKYVFLTLALPKDTETSWLEEFLNGFNSLLARHEVTLLGGDTVRSTEKIMISVTATGEAPTKNLKYRSTAKTGDIICVTRTLGDSAAGLDCILKNVAQSIEAEKLVERHYRPQPQLREAQLLARAEEVTAMMDLSDGLNADIKKILAASGVGAEIHLEQLPLSDELQVVSQAQNWNCLELAATGGEDYCLLLCIEPKAFARIQAEYKKNFGEPLFPIGEIKNSADGLTFKLNDTPVHFKTHSFEHF